MVGLIFLATLFRYLPGIPGIFWAEEVARYLLIWTVFLSSGLAIRRGAHIAVDILPTTLKGKARSVLLTVNWCAVGTLLGILLFYGARMARLNMSQMSSALQMPMGIPYLAIPVGAGIMLIEVGVQIAEAWRPSQPGQDPSCRTREEVQPW
jgi:C4-dicarboxylate transporter DctQ subunit